MKMKAHPIRHSFVKRIGNPRRVGLDNVLGDLRPFLRRESLDLLDDFLCAHTCSIHENKSLRKAFAPLKDLWIPLLAKHRRWARVRIMKMVTEHSNADEPLTPRDALRRLQDEARLSPQEAKQYLQEIRDERLAAENQISPLAAMRQRSET
jgi:hypothetical protein